MHDDDEERDPFDQADEELADGKVNPGTLRRVLASLRPGGDPEPAPAEAGADDEKKPASDDKGGAMKGARK